MITAELLKKARPQKLGKTPVVVLPVPNWETMRERMEFLEEFYQMSVSKKYKRDIATARASKQKISSRDLYSKLGLI